VAQRTILQLTDDLDGKHIPDGKGEAVQFGLDRQDYEIDLADNNAKALREALQTYISAGRRVGGGSRASNTRSGRPRSNGTRTTGTGTDGTGAAAGRDYDPKAVRAWAEEQGIEVNQRGRVPADLITKFQEANV
jgi:hypothetical protein